MVPEKRRKNKVKIPICCFLVKRISPLIPKGGGERCRARGRKIFPLLAHAVKEFSDSGEASGGFFPVIERDHTVVVFQKGALVLGRCCPLVGVERGIDTPFVSSYEVRKHVGSHPDVVLWFLEILHGAYGGEGFGDAFLVDGPFDLHKAIASTVLGVGPHGGLLYDDPREEKGIHPEFTGGLEDDLSVFFGVFAGELGVFFPKEGGDGLIRRGGTFGISEGAYGEKVPIVIEKRGFSW